MAFAEEMQRFSKAHHFAKENIDGIRTRYLLCGKADARYTLVYLVGGTGISDVWFNHIIQMEEDYQILTFDYSMKIGDLEKLADHIVKLIKKARSLESRVHRSFIGWVYRAADCKAVFRFGVRCGFIFHVQPVTGEHFRLEKSSTNHTV